MALGAKHYKLILTHKNRRIAGNETHDSVFTLADYFDNFPILNFFLRTKPMNTPDVIAMAAEGEGTEGPERVNAVDVGSDIVLPPKEIYPFAPSLESAQPQRVGKGTLPTTESQ